MFKLNSCCFKMKLTKDDHYFSFVFCYQHQHIVFLREATILKGIQCVQSITMLLVYLIICNMLLFVLPFKKSQLKHETSEENNSIFKLENSAMYKFVIPPQWFQVKTRKAHLNSWDKVLNGAPKRGYLGSKNNLVLNIPHLLTG